MTSAVMNAMSEKNMTRRDRNERARRVGSRLTVLYEPLLLLVVPESVPRPITKLMGTYASAYSDLSARCGASKR